MSKRKIYKTNPVRKYLLLSLFLLFFIGIGFSILGTDISIAGSVNVEEYDNTLYGVIKNATKDGLAVKYTGTHQDSIDASKSTKDIYYFNSDSSAEDTEIKNKYNVFFGGYCWQMLRTTDTGGVKLIYNGKSENRKCLDDRRTHAGVGGYNDLIDIDAEYYYGDSYEVSYNSETDTYTYFLRGNVFKSAWNETTFPNLVGKYTCLLTENTECTDMVWITEYVDSTHGAGTLFEIDIPYSSIGRTGYNHDNNSIADVGYKYNKVYPMDTHSLGDVIDVIESYKTRMSSTSYAYSDSVRYNQDTGLYELYNQDNSQVSTYLYSSSYQNLPEHYTCNSTSTTCSTVYYVVSTKTSLYYYLLLQNGNLLSDVDYNIVTGSDFSGKTLINPEITKMSKWANQKDNLIGRYICYNFDSSNCEEVLYIGSAAPDGVNGWSTGTAGYYKYGQGYTYQNGQYKLTGDIVQSLFFGNQDIIDFDNYYYSCLSDSDTCDSIYIVQFSKKATQGITSFTRREQVQLNNGESFQDAINNMLYANDVNKNDSRMKMMIDDWYRMSNLANYAEDYIDDVIYCNDRTATNDLSLIGVSERMNIYYDNEKTNNSVDYSCNSITDRFSVSNNSAKLDYPIGLPTSEELNALGTDALRATDYYYYTMSPKWFQTGSTIHVMGTSGTFNMTAGIASDFDIRPVIAIKAGIPINAGDGSKEAPYIIEDF